MQIKPFLVPVALLVISLTLGIGGGLFLLGRITGINTQLSSLNSEQPSLNNKLSTLQNLGDKVVADSSLALFALPTDNVIAISLSQIRELISENNLNLISLSANPSSSITSDLNSSVIEFKVGGEYQSFKTFVKSIENLMPLVNISGLSVSNGTSGSFEMSASLDTFWASLPQNLPSVTEPIESLTDDEINVLDQLSSFTKPKFINLEPQTASDLGRIDPFKLQ